MNNSRLDQDIAVYAADVEWARSKLRLCPTNEEPYWNVRLHAARQALAALENLKTVINLKPTTWSMKEK